MSLVKDKGVLFVYQVDCNFFIVDQPAYAHILDNKIENPKFCWMLHRKPPHIYFLTIKDTHTHDDDV